ncbi:hypothetical protein FD15_GL000918 [Liquorilactobacillus sucicola DSM 21376 = JCM 15457]|uniref:Uncharacterized protein n=2 Tax=Liquorilactobacillus sucicola TaxID=519050 RepID=A0A0R2DX70_9LACO|nr:hypothetical protein FD15_GL000918 [Liquorilactobacillus sucicola DSM 21376 = JCM 15457]
MELTTIKDKISTTNVTEAQKNYLVNTLENEFQDKKIEKKADALLKINKNISEEKLTLKLMEYDFLTTSNF